MKKLLLLLALSSTALAVDKQIIAPTGSVVVKGNSTVKMQTYNTGAWQDRLTIANDGTITGNGSGLTSLNGTNISSGTVSASYLPAAGPSASGIVNQSIQTFAGQKTFSTGITTNALTEYTSTNGVQIQGRTSSTSPASGNIGYYLHNSRTAAKGISSSTSLDVDVTITQGWWLLIFKAGLSSNNTDIYVEAKAGSTVLGIMRKYTVGIDAVGNDMFIYPRYCSAASEVISMVTASYSGTGAVLGSTSGGGTGNTSITAIRIH